MKNILYLTRNGLLEPLGQSQIWPYIRELSCNYRITLISYEKFHDRFDQAAMQRMRCQCTVYGIRWIPLKFFSHPRPWAPVFAIFQLVLVALWQFRSCDRPHLVHARSYVSASIALVLYRLIGTPFIFDMRALWPEELIVAGHLQRGSLLHRGLLWLEMCCLQDAGAVVSLTYAALRYLKHRYPREKTGHKIVVIPTCADLQRFQCSELDSVTPLVIGCIGTVLSGWFLVDWLQSFLEAIVELDHTFRFELVSQDSPAEILNALKLSPACVSRLRIRAATPSEMPGIVLGHSASVMFFTSGLSKLGSSPTRMAEVLGCGRPIVVNSGVGDVEEIVRSRNIGIVVNDSSRSSMKASAIKLFSLLKDCHLSHRCRLAAEELFSLKSGVAAYQKLYQALLDESKHNPIGNF